VREITITARIDHVIWLISSSVQRVLPEISGAIAERRSIASPGTKKGMLTSKDALAPGSRMFEKAQTATNKITPQL
jgi:hypothetical protein